MLLRINEQRSILHEIRKRKANWIGHILWRNCLLKQVTEGKLKGEMEVTRRRGRRRKKVLDDLKDRRGYYHLKEEALDRTMWRKRFGKGVGPVVRQITEWMNEFCKDLLPYIVLGLKIKWHHCSSSLTSLHVHHFVITECRKLESMEGRLVVAFILSSMKTGHLVQKLNGCRHRHTHTHTHMHRYIVWQLMKPPGFP